ERPCIETLDGSAWRWATRSLQCPIANVRDPVLPAGGGITRAPASLCGTALSVMVVAALIRAGIRWAARHWEPGGNLNLLPRAGGGKAGVKSLTGQRF